MRTADKRPYPVILLFGPTAVGKTDLLASFAPEKIEIINADSMQVYRHMDIGTAKPSTAIRSRIPHHLIDILDPEEQYSAGMFVDLADGLVPEILSRGHLPVLSGGTAFYFKNFIYGLPETPAVDETVREAVRRDLHEAGAKKLFEELRRIDPLSWERIHAGDTYRITRAVEVYRQTGRPLSEYAEGGSPRKEYIFRVIGLRRPREELYRRINKRVEEMFRRGLPGEIAELLRSGYTREDPGMKAIGYREFFAMREEGCLTMAGVRERVRQASRRYAKRQMTFFGKLPGAVWFSPEEREEIRGYIAEDKRFAKFGKVV